MPIISIENLGKLGMVADVLPHDLPPEAWTNARNVHFRDNHVIKMNGMTEVLATSPIAPYWLLSVPADTYFWLVAGAAKVYVTDGTAYTNITRQTAGSDVNYAMNQDLLWNGGLLGGVPVINNGVDPPQFWNPQTTATKLQALTGWPANTVARVIRPFKQFLFALNITKNTTTYQHMVKWSHSADPGAVPSSWDHTDPTLDAGEFDLTDIAAGPLVDGLALRDAMMLYKEGSVYGALYVGGQFIFRFYKVFEQLGALDTNCVALVGDGDKHIVMTGEDIVVHNGQAAESVLTRRMRRWLTNALDPDNYKRSFMLRDVFQRKNWFCFPEAGNDWPNLAIIYDWDNGTITTRELAQRTSYIAPGRIVSADIGAWDDDSQVWDDDSEAWDATAHPPYQYRLLQASPETTKLFFLDNGNNFDGADMQSFVERTGLAIYGKDREGNWKADITKMKLIKGLRPKLREGPLRAQVGVQQFVGGPITWAPLQDFSASDYKLDFLLTGRLVAVRFEGLNNVIWSLNGYDLDIELLGDF